MHVLIQNTQKDLKLSKRAARKYILAALQFLDVSADEIHVNFVTEKKICFIHERFFNDPSPTDCITLPLDEDEESFGYKLLGEVFICLKAALSYPDPYKETGLYIVHTLLHLIGYRDGKPEERLKMRRVEKRVLAHLYKKNLRLDMEIV
ncbi:MAG: rRNA maturation RNase YbeY [Chlamydiae bacterium]|nr:rRNA maturation RNase YbeY [Chlamydiota bacterium]